MDGHSLSWLCDCSVNLKPSKRKGFTLKTNRVGQVLPEGSVRRTPSTARFPWGPAGCPGQAGPGSCHVPSAVGRPCGGGRCTFLPAHPLLALIGPYL